jgi:hypothetical protein
VKGKLLSSGVAFDTTLAINVTAFLPQPEAPLISIGVAPVPAGVKRCFDFMLYNLAPAGSPPFIIRSATLTTPDSAFDLSPITNILPISVKAQDSVDLTFCFQPHDSLLHWNFAKMTTDCKSFSFNINGYGRTGIITAPDTTYGTVKVGDQKCADLLVRNIGSYPFTVKGAVHSDTVNFLVDSHNLPQQIDGLSSKTYSVCFNPKSEGTFFDTIRWVTDLDALFKDQIKSYSIVSGRTANSAVRALDAVKAFSLRPNPAHEEIVVELAAVPGAGTPVEIFDALGKKVFASERNLQSGMNEIHIDTRNLPAGIYLVRVGNAAQNFVKE